MAGRLQWTSWQSTAHALISAHRVHCALRGCRGLVGHRFAVELRTRSVWTRSAWSTRTTLVEFSRGEAHSSVRGATETALMESTFCFWGSEAVLWPPGWSEVRQRIDEAAERAG
jgi:hypothetical protein